MSKLGLNFEKIITFGRWRERYCRTLFFGCMLISQFSYVENSLHFIWQILKTNILLSKFLLYCCFHFTENIAYHNPEMSIVCVDKVLVMGRSRNSCVLNFAILLQSRKLEAREISCFTVGVTASNVSLIGS